MTWGITRSTSPAMLRVLKNFAALSILQIGNYVLPLIMVPFLARSLGMTMYGNWALVGAIVGIARTIVSYGFDLTATRSASVNRDDPLFLSQLHGTVLVIRLTLFVVCVLVIWIGLLAIPGLSHIHELALASTSVLLGEILFPVWLFQGTEQMATITHVRLIYRTFFVAAVIVFVRSEHQVMLIPLFEGLGSLVSGAVATTIAFKRYSLRWIQPSAELIGSQLRDGGSVFASLASVHLYTSLNAIFLGAQQGPLAVAQYSLGEKIYSAVRGVFTPAIQALFPWLAARHKADIAAYRITVRHLTVVFVACLLILAAVLVAFSSQIALMVSGTRDATIEAVLKVFAFCLLLAMGALLSPLLVIQGQSKSLLCITALTTAVSLICVFPLIHFNGAAGAAEAFAAAQFVHAAGLIYTNRQSLFLEPQQATVVP